MNHAAITPTAEARTNNPRTISPRAAVLNGWTLPSYCATFTYRGGLDANGKPDGLGVLVDDEYAGVHEGAMTHGLRQGRWVYRNAAGKAWATCECTDGIESSGDWKVLPPSGP